MLTSLAPFYFLPGSRASAGEALVINIFGGPGSGKSTLASRLFFELKRRDIEAASPEEHAKLAIWSGQPWLLDQQAILLGRTWETIHALHDKVEVIIVDSPIMLCSVYAHDREPVCFHQLVADIHCRTDRINLLLARDPDLEYSMNGRRETAREAQIVDERIMTTLDSHDEPFSEIGRSDTDVATIADAITQQIRDA